MELRRGCGYRSQGHVRSQTWLHYFSLILLCFNSFHNEKGKTRKETRCSRQVCPLELVAQQAKCLSEVPRRSWTGEEAVSIPHSKATDSEMTIQGNQKGFQWFLHKESRLNYVNWAFFLIVFMTIGLLNLSALCCNAGTGPDKAVDMTGA